MNRYMRPIPDVSRVSAARRRKDRWLRANRQGLLFTDDAFVEPHRVLVGTKEASDNPVKRRRYVERRIVQVLALKKRRGEI